MGVTIAPATSGECYVRVSHLTVHGVMGVTATAAERAMKQSRQQGKD